MKIQQPQSTEFELAPAEQHQAVICDVIDCGWKERNFQGQYKGVGPRIKLVYQTATTDSEGRRYLLFDWEYFISWDHRSGWYDRLAGIIGSQAVEALLAAGEFEPESLLGKNVMVMVVHKEHNGKTYANVDRVAAWNTKFGPDIVPLDYKRRHEGENWEQPYPSAFADYTHDEAEAILRDEGKLTSAPLPPTNRPTPAPQTQNGAPHAGLTKEDALRIRDELTREAAAVGIDVGKPANMAEFLEWQTLARNAISEARMRQLTGEEFDDSDPFGD